MAMKGDGLVGTNERTVESSLPLSTRKGFFLLLLTVVFLAPGSRHM